MQKHDAAFYRKPNLNYLRPMRLIYLAFILVFLTGNPLHAQVEQDKVIHFAVGAISGAAGAYVASELSGQNRFWTVTGSIATSLLAGLAKEAVDKRRYDNWDNADLGATVLGGVTVGITIELFTKKNGRRYQSRKKNGATALFETSPEPFFRKEHGNSDQLTLRSDRHE